MSFWEKVSSFFTRKTVEKTDQVSNKVTSVTKLQLDDVEMVKTVEPARARNEEGKFIADDKSTKDVNEAWEGGVAPKKKSPKVIKKKSR
jgi:hypothetical protein|tara:strand:- start:304 stop:570 length:267 start_codon:yes stop_codon:yes gene_type:complete